MSTTEQYTRTQEQTVAFWRQQQDAYVDALQRWSQTVSKAWNVADADVAGQWAESLPRPTEAVDAAFDLAEQVLSTQRALVHRWLEASGPVVEAAAQQQREAIVQGQQTSRRAAESARDTARKTAETAKRTQRTNKREKYEAMTVEQLQEEAGKADIEGRSSMNKDELVKALANS